MAPTTAPQAPLLRVEAHPHTGLQTFTWMLAGELLHRDSLGSEQVVRPGQVNLMTAGRGVVHTEDALTPVLHAAQLWIALPEALADMPPAFEHHTDLPRWALGGLQATLLVGRCGSQRAPTRVHSPLLGLHLDSPGGGAATWDLDPTFEHLVTPLVGAVWCAGEAVAPGGGLYLGPGACALDLRLAPGAQVLVLGGQPLDQPVTMWWNFVGHSRSAVAQAQADWAAGGPRFPLVPGEAPVRMVAPRPPWSV
jgi:redox-sensitive bicupin YhaK (pirin superfamily)